MAQRSIRSFFAAKPQTSGPKSEDLKQKKAVEDDENIETKENIPNSSNIEPSKPSTSSSRQENGGKESAPVETGAEESAHVENGAQENGEKDTDLSLPIPYRKTARKSFKRKSDVEQLQEEKMKKMKPEPEPKGKDIKVQKEVKSKKSSPVSKPTKEDKKSKGDSSSKIKSSPEKDIKSSPAKSEKDDESPRHLISPPTEEYKPETESTPSSPQPMECDDSPVKVKSKRNRILSDSEDETEPSKPIPESPEKKFSIFDKSKTSDKKSPQKVSKSANKSPAKKSPKAIKSEKSPEKSSETKSTESSPVPSTSGTQSTPKPKNPFQGFFSPKPSVAGKKGDGMDYDKKVKKTQYHPIEDCFWGRGEKTPYLALANTLLAIEETSGRLRTIEMLSNYLRSVIVQTPEDLLPSIYMILNRLAPAWEGIELGVGEFQLMKAIANTTGRSAAQIKAEFVKVGDMGKVAESSKSSQRTMFQPAPLTVSGVFTRLREIAEKSGNSSSSKKVDKIQSLLVACRGSESRFLVRSLAGKLRIGLAEQSVLQALAQACVQTPIGQDYPPSVHTAFKSAESDSFKEKLASEALKLKTAYCECPTYDLVIPALLETGIDGVSAKCKLTPGIPLKPMLACPTKGVQEVLTRFENCKFTCEWKYDGERAQIHLLENGDIKIYSRNQEDNTTKYPDIIKRFQACLTPEVKSAVVDCEAVAWDREKKQIQPFQVLSTRKRKDAVESEIKVQVCLFGFDLLYLNGEALVRKPFQERRDLLREKFQEVAGEFQFAQGVDGTTTEEIQVALEDSIKDNCEGLMVKTLDREATYEIARRSHNWLKLKKDYLDGVGDTMDLVVIGGYQGKGKRTGGYGGFLLACYDAENEEYQTICKIGTGFTDEDLTKHAAFFKDHVIDKPKGYYSFDPVHAPDHWFEPVQVWEVKCADISVSPVHKAALGLVDPGKGVSLRFPRFICIREDKNTEDATSSEQIAEMYNNQDQIKNQNKPANKNADDDFDF